MQITITIVAEILSAIGFYWAFIEKKEDNKSVNT